MTTLILIRGAICAGKTTLVEELAKKLPQASFVDEDAFKRAIDKKGASSWRSAMAFSTALFLTEKLMKTGRIIIADIHSSKKDRYEEYADLAKRNNYTLRSFLLRPPLETCIARNRKRVISDVNYSISDTEITTYWEKLYDVAHEVIFDTNSMKTEEVVEAILCTLSVRL